MEQSYKKDQISFVKSQNNVYTIYFEDDISLGKLMQSDDGFYYWFPCDFEGSCISNWILKVISDKVEELNKEWNQIIEDEFNKYKE